MIKKIAENPLFQKYQALIIPVVSLLVCIALVILVILPQFFAYSNQQKVQTENKNKLSSLNQKVKSLENVDISTYKSDLTTSFIALPSDRDVPNSINQILFFLANSRLKLTNISFANAAAINTQLDTYQVKIEIEGSNPNLKEFIAKIKDAPRLIRVDGIELSSSGDPNKIQATLTLSMFSQGIDNQLGDVEKPLVIASENDLAVLNKIKENSKIVPGGQGTDNITGSVGKSDPFQ